MRDYILTFKNPGGITFSQRKLLDNNQVRLANLYIGKTDKDGYTLISAEPVEASVRDQIFKGIIRNC
jgi:hypothetical protein